MAQGMKRSKTMAKALLNLRRQRALSRTKRLSKYNQFTTNVVDRVA